MPLTISTNSTIFEVKSHATNSFTKNSWRSRHKRTQTILGISLAVAQIFGIAIAEAASDNDFLSALRKLPRNLSVKAPEYPKDAFEKGIEGEVVLEFALTPDGHARNIVIAKSEPPGIFTSAVSAVFPTWLFLPDFNNPCTSIVGRSRQHVYFQIKDGNPKISILPLDDIKDIRDELEVPPSDTTLKQEAVATNGEERFELFTASKLRYKTEPTIRYPTEAQKARLRGFVVSTIRIQPDGKIANIEHRYSIPEKYFKEAIDKAMISAEFETMDGNPPGQRRSVCQEFAFELTN